jgi:ubiquitin C-terminal hydrolase
MNQMNNSINMNQMNNAINMNQMNNANNMNQMNNGININQMNQMNNMNNVNIMNQINNINKNTNNLNVNANNYNMYMNKMNNEINQFNLNNQKINNYLNEDVKIIEEKDKPIYPHKTGLQNVGQTCYMNSTIQCLSNIKFLTDYLIKHYGKFDLDTQPLSIAFSSLVYDLFTTKKKYIVPNTFKNIIGTLNPLFEGMHAADVKDLIFFLLEKLHHELNKGNKTDEINIDYAQLEKDSFNENKMFENFIKDYTEKNKSIISDTFYGIIRSTMKCNDCKRIKYSFQTFNLLIFQLKNVKEFKQKSQIEGSKFFITIYDAFECDKKEEILEGENMIYCNSCKGLRSGTHQQIIFSLPRVLIIVLNRGKNNLDFNEEFRFPKDLDLGFENYTVNNSQNKHFYLQSVITHLGESGSGGHFIAYCRNGPNGNFLCYNDAVVSSATIEDAMRSNISEKVYEKRTPYILVYYQMDDPINK